MTSDAEVVFCPVCRVVFRGPAYDFPNNWEYGRKTFDLSDEEYYCFCRKCKSIIPIRFSLGYNFTREGFDTIIPALERLGWNNSMPTINSWDLPCPDKSTGLSGMLEYELERSQNQEE